MDSLLDADALLRDVNFAADHGVDAVVLGVIVELDGAEEVAVIGHGDGGHFLLGDDLHELRDLAGSIEQRVVGVAVKMNERVRHTIINPGETFSIAGGRKLHYGCGGEIQWGRHGDKETRCEEARSWD